MAALVGGGLKVKPGEVSPGASRRAVPGRAAGIPARRAGQSAPADRDRRGGGGARQCPCALSGALPAGGGDESLPLRLSQRSGAGLRPRAQMRRSITSRASPGPLFDRIDLHVEVAGVSRQRPGAAAAGRRQRRGRARAWRRRAPIQRERFAQHAHPHQCRSRRRIAGHASPRPMRRAPSC